MAKMTNGITQSQNVAVSLSFILMRVQMRERQNEIDYGWARIPGSFCIQLFIQNFIIYQI